MQTYYSSRMKILQCRKSLPNVRITAPQGPGIVKILVLAKAIARAVTAATNIMDVANGCHARSLETGVDYRLTVACRVTNANQLAGIGESAWRSLDRAWGRIKSRNGFLKNARDLTYDARIIRQRALIE
ncbi:uncharacterized protein [Montipora capricornis]|uniref:uncharacterized protein n=1 Tax=Montipora capricornis TaxID=246305 RepID=UPI0035F19502